MQGRYL